MGGLISPPIGLDIDPDTSIEAAADVVAAMVTAAFGKGWLCCPS